MQGMVIIGAGHAGSRAAQTLVEKGWKGPIHLINSEAVRPYERPPVSKSILSGHKTTSDVALLPEEFFACPNVTYTAAVSASAIDRQLQTIRLSDGRQLPYHRLLIATGSRSRTLHLPDPLPPEVFTLRSAADAEMLRSHLKAGAHLVVIGGGLIGLEVAATARGLGCSVSVVETGPRLLMRMLTAELEAGVRSAHIDAGVSIHLESTILRILGTARVEGVELQTGEVLPCDAVLICIGARRETSIAEACGLVVDDGIVVDELLQTNDPHIFAAGDVCCLHSQDPPVRLECWKNAGDQGALAAENMLGASKPYNAIPWMWSDQYDKVIQAVGLVGPGQDVVVKELGRSGKAAFHFQRGRLTAVVGYGAIGVVARTVRVGQAMLERRISPTPEAIFAASDIRSFLVDC
jgi:3-phenylpropionate/trans-cinnamate dioxygenase ferredoxin reductase subunit